MSAIIGERDTLLQATAQRFDPTADSKAILLSAATPIFHVSAAGVGTPASIAITAQPVNVKGSVTFTVTQGTTIAVNGNVATVDFAAMSTDTAQVMATVREFGVDYVAYYMVSKVFDGKAGDAGLAGLNSAQAFAYKRASAAPADTPGDVIYTFASAAITTPAGNDLANGWSKTMPLGTGPIYVRVASASSRNGTDAIAANEWTAPVLLAKDGVDGMNVAPIRIYQRGVTNIAPALPTVRSTFTFATGALEGLNNGWSTQVPIAGGAYLFTSGATAAGRGATDDVEASEWAAATRLAADGAPGQRGTVTVTAPGYSVWTDASAVYELGRAGYGTPINRDTVTLYDATHAVTKFFADGGWLPLGTVLNGNLLVDGTVAARALAVDRLSAINANLGNVTAGDLYGTTLHGGPGYPGNAYGWPSNGGIGYHLSERGLLLGNPSTGGYVELGAGGYVAMPGLEIRGGNAIFSGALAAASGTFAGNLTAVSGTLGTITSGYLQNATNTSYVNLNATDDQTFIQAGGGKIRLNADGSGTFARKILSEPNVVRSGKMPISVGWRNSTMPFTVYVDTGETFSDLWYEAPSAAYIGNATLAGGQSESGGLSGYVETTIVIGGGLYNGTQNPIGQRIYLRVTWTPGVGAGRINPASIAWKLVKV